MVIPICLVVIYIKGDIHKGTFNASSGAWKEQKNSNNYSLMKGDEMFIVQII